MQVQYYVIRGITYSIKAATSADVEIDYNKVLLKLSNVGDELSDKDAYKARMYSAVDNRLAYVVYKEDCRFGGLYIDKIEQHKMYGASMHADDIYGFLAFLWFMSDTFKNVTKLLIAPHGNNIKYFISIADGASVRKFNSGMSQYITINLVKLAKKCSLLEKYLCSQPASGESNECGS